VNDNKRAVLYVTVKCPICGATRKISPGEVAADDFPMCQRDGLPMLPQKAVSVTESRRRP